MRVLHFVTGGFSGATQVAIDLALMAQTEPDMQTLLVLRRKRHTDLRRVQALRERGLDVLLVPGWAHAATVWALRAVARRWRPDVLVAHGFSEHLWGRYAGLLAGVPHLLHVEHNARERYTPWRLAQARWLARRTDAIVGVSEGVRQVLLGLGFPPEKCRAIHNGIDTARFPAAGLVPWAQREPAIVMAARFGRQKDHATLIRAVALLAQDGLRPVLYLAGQGQSRLMRRNQRLAHALGLEQQVRFCGHVTDLPALLMRTRICVLSTHFEGMGLSLVEGMAAGCACIGTDVVGVREVIDPGRTGLLVPEGDAPALARALHGLLTDDATARRLAEAARAEALRRFDTRVMLGRYAALLRAVQAGQPLPA